MIGTQTRLMILVLFGVLSGCRLTSEKTRMSEEGERLDIQGSWQGPCVDVSTFEGEQSSISIFRFQGKGAIYEELSFSDAHCEDLFARFEVDMIYFDAGFNLTVENSRKIDLELKSIYLTYLREDVIELVNEGFLFGFENWEVGVPQNVTGLMAIFGVDPLPYEGEKSFYIYAIRNDTLYFGDLTTGDGTSEAQRPTGLEAEGYRRQRQDSIRWSTIFPDLEG